VNAKQETCHYKLKYLSPTGYDSFDIQDFFNLTKLPVAQADIVLLLPAVNEFLWAFRKALRLGATDPEC
jgi:hypothetical protein